MARRGGGRGGGGFSSGVGIGCGIAVGCVIAIGVIFVVMGGSCMGLALWGGAPAVDVAAPDGAPTDGATEPAATDATDETAPDAPTGAPDEAEPEAAAPAGAAEAGGEEAEPETPPEPQGRPVRVVLKSGATLTGRIVAETNRTVTLKAGRSTMKLQRGEILRIEEQGEE